MNVNSKKRIEFDENILFEKFSDFKDKSESWKVIIADDEKEVHAVTRMVLKEVSFDGKPIEFISTYSGEETKAAIQKYPDTAVILLDVVMEKDDTGLEIVKYIREEVCNKTVRIVLRTGQSGQAPERDVIDNYDINDYKQKTDLTAQKLYTTLTVALRGYRDLMLVEKSQTKVSVIKHFLNNILESMSSGFIVVDKEFNITLCNGIAKDVFSPDIESLLGQNLFKASHILRKYESAFHASVSENVIKTIYSIKQLTNRYINIMIYPFHFKEFSGLVIRIDDVSEIVARDEQIRRIQKLDTIGTLAAGLAHDFNNILGGISGAVSLIKIELPNTPEESLIRAGVETVDESVARASGIVKKLLTLAKKQNMPVTPIELNDVINNIMSICEKSIDKSIKTEINYSGSKAYINGDISQIEQVILNLCINASHAMTIMRSDESQWGGTLKISIYPTTVNDEIYRVYRDIKNTDFYVIEVSDTGIGIEDSLRSKIFDPFFSTKKKDSGTGLGLSMVYNTITQHGGHLILNSEVGKGSTFKLYFPAIDFPDDGQNDIPFKKGSGVILVADNEPAVVHIIHKTLTLCGYKVLTAGNGEEALEIYKNNKVDFVISDSDMPKISGTDLYWKLKEHNPDVKFVFITGLELNNEMSACIDNGALGLIIKPFNMHSFSNKIYDLLNGSEIHDSK